MGQASRKTMDLEDSLSIARAWGPIMNAQRTHGNSIAILMTWVLLGLALGAFLLLSGSLATAQTSIRYVAATGTDSGTCFDPGFPCRSVQYALDVASEADIIKVAAGLYTGTSGESSPAQVVYIDKTVTLRGGYSTANRFGDPPDPKSNPTTLDAQLQGRVIYITGDISPTIEGLRITGGEAFGLGGGLWGEDVGGGVYIEQASATLRFNTIYDNQAYSGGGLYLYNSDSVLQSNTISDNIAYGSGPLPPGGGGLYLLEGRALLEGNALTANRTSGDGGGILLFNGAGPTLRGNTFVANSASQGGGLFLSHSDALVEGNAIISNSASLGGGLHVSPNSYTHISANTIFSNSADFGGGLYLHASYASIDENAIVSNWADRGGGLYLSADSASLNRNTIQANSAAEGAGLALSRSNATLANNLIAGNLGSLGSGLRIEGSSPRLLHTTIVGGGGLDSGVWISASKQSDPNLPSVVWLTNTILVSHAVGITVAQGNTATLAATLWGTGTWANHTDWGGAGTIATGTVNLWQDPAFVNPAAGDYHLGPGSTAADGGLGVGVEDDLDGEARPIGPAPDIGADEAGVLVGKGATSARVWSGALLTYTLRITNTSNIDLQAIVTDLLPLNVTTTQPLAWTPLISASGGVWAETLTVTVEKGYAGHLSNEVLVSTGAGARGAASVTVWAIMRVYLPLVLR